MKRKKSLIAAILVVTLLLLVGCNDKDNDNESEAEEMQTTVTFVNNTGVDIYYLYASPTGTEDWEEDILDIDVLEDEEAFEVEFYYTSDQTVWDFRIEDIEENHLDFYDLDFDDYDGDDITIILHEDGNAYIE